MGRHAREGESPVPTTTAPTTGRHRLGTRRRFSLSVFFHRPRHRPHMTPQVNEFGHEGATVGYGGTLSGIKAVTRPNLALVPPPVAPPARRLVPIPALMTSVRPTALDLPPLLDAPTYYRRLANPVPGT